MSNNFDKIRACQKQNEYFSVYNICSLMIDENEASLNLDLTLEGKQL